MLVSGALALAAVVGTAPIADGATLPGPPEIVCGGDRRIIQIHGTDSTGAFDPNDIVRNLDPAQPDPSIFAADASVLNLEFGDLVAGASAACLLTFSYDDVYLTQNGARRAGVNAWNLSTSPWNRQPDELADHLQRLMDSFPANVTFDLIGYSAGGIVPTYWAARPQTTDAQRARVHSIIVVDGIVSGVDVGIVDFACLLPKSLRNVQIASYGRFPCQFRHDGPYTTTVRTTDWWTKIPFATVRAKGDLIVWHRFAGLPGKTVVPIGDPALRAKFCPLLNWFTDLGQCVLDTHGSVLNDQGAIDTIAEMIALPP